MADVFVGAKIFEKSALQAGKPWYCGVQGKNMKNIGTIKATLKGLTAALAMPVVGSWTRLPLRCDGDLKGD